MGGGSWDSGAYWGFGCRVQVGGVMGFWSHLGIWLSGIGGRKGREEEENEEEEKESERNQTTPP